MSAGTDRIELSRARLRLAMTPPPAPARSQQARPWLDRMRTLPILEDVLASLRHWWSAHPLRPVGLVAGEAAGAVMRPVALRHPYALVLGAAVAGGVLAWARPWRWLLRSTLFAGLVPQLASRVASSLPLESWMTTVGAMMSAPPKRRAAAAPPPVPEAAADPAQTAP